MGNNCWSEDNQLNLRESKLTYNRESEVSGPTISRKTLAHWNSEFSNFEDANNAFIKLVNKQSSTVSNEPNIETLDVAFIIKQTRVVRQGKKIRK